MKMKAITPVFIVGVPGSGTTLLRVMLDSHPYIASGPEAPWLCGVYGKRRSVSLKKLYNDLIFKKRGPVYNFEGIEEQDVAKAVRSVMDTIMEKYCRSKGKTRWVEKTPNNITQIPFIHSIYPDAIYIHIMRDGRDVACSTVNRFGKRIKYDHDKKIRLKNTRLNALKRWRDWNSDFYRWKLEFKLRVHHLKYEELVMSPKETISEVLDFLEEPWSDQVVQYSEHEHDYPEWETGSREVKRYDRIHKRSVDRWKLEFTWIEKLQIKKRFDSYLVSHGYPPSKKQ